MPSCPNCGASNTQIGKACDYCGVVVDIQQGNAVVGIVPCPDCSANNRPGQVHCESCGTALFHLCPQCRSRVYLAASHCGQCGAEQHRNSPSLDSVLVDGYRSLGNGDHARVERTLEDLPAESMTPQSRLLLAKAKQMALLELGQDVRFRATWEQKRLQLVELLNQVVDEIPNTSDAAEAQQILAQTTMAGTSKAKSGCATLVVVTAAAIAILSALFSVA